MRLRERPTSSNTAIVCAATVDQMVNLLRFVDQGFGGLLSAFELIDNSFYKVNTGAGKHAPPLSADQPYYAIIEMLGSQQERDTELFETILGEAGERGFRSEEHTSELQSLMRTSYADFCLKKKTHTK